ncbi:MAG: citrate transporter [Ruminococcus sp.]|nr:citrate transporter [Ruminococcus sp.]
MRGAIAKAKAFFRAQPVLVISFLAAAVTVFIVPPDGKYADYCNRTVLIELFALMLAVSGFRSIGAFDSATRLILSKTGNIRSLGRVLVLICFFTSMLVTNDVALITFVPLTLMIFRGCTDEKSRIMTIVLETAAANMGSMLTPVGNPQNLYLYDEFGMSVGEFVTATLPCGLISLACLMGLSFLLPKTLCEAPETSEGSISKSRAAVYGTVFGLCLACVLRLVPDWICLIAAVAAALICDVSLLKKVDYALLATFVCFFVFVGNIARIDAVSDFFRDILAGREILVAIGLSQVISNVPAAVMLSGFTDNGKALLLGVDLGGLGTMIASLASLISFQFYRKAEGARPARYMLTFTAVSLAMLAVLIPAVLIL